MKKRNGSRDRMVKMEKHPAKARVTVTDEVYDGGTFAGSGKVTWEPCDCPQCERERKAK